MMELKIKATTTTISTNNIPPFFLVFIQYCRPWFFQYTVFINYLCWSYIGVFCVSPFHFATVAIFIKWAVLVVKFPASFAFIQFRLYHRAYRLVINQASYQLTLVSFNIYQRFYRLSYAYKQASISRMFSLGSHSLFSALLFPAIVLAPVLGGCLFFPKVDFLTLGKCGKSRICLWSPCFSIKGKVNRHSIRRVIVPHLLLVLGVWSRFS
jgi:hypothetical protein